MKVFDDLSDPTATVFADLRTNVHNYWDRDPVAVSLGQRLRAAADSLVEVT